MLTAAVRSLFWCLARALLALAPICGAWPIAATAEAQPLQPTLAGYGHTVWTTRDGLPHNMIRTLLQTRDGYLWIGTSNGGLVRFDGLAFTVFDVATTPGLPSNWVSALHEDADGVLWVGTGQGLARYANGTFTPEPFEDSTAHKSVYAIQADRGGRMWVMSNGHLARRDGQGWTKMALGREDLTCVLPNRDGSAWIGTADGLLEWRNGIVRTLTVADGLPHQFIHALYEDPDGQIWIGTDRGLAYLDRERRTVRPAPAPLASLSINAFLVDRDGTRWIGAAGRLFARTRGGTLAEHVISDRAEAAQVRTLAADREGHLWFGLDGGRGGLHRLRRHDVRMLGHEQGLPCDNVAPITETADGTVWVGSFCGPGGVVAVRDGQTRVHPGPHHVSALLADTDGTLWAGDHDGTLFHFEHGQFVRYPTAFGTPSAILALHRDSQGALWVGTRLGLFRQMNGQWTRFGQPDGLATDNVRSIVAGRDGSLWIGLDEGLAHYARGRFTTYTTANGLPRVPIRGIHVDAAGTVWIGTYGGGLCRLKAGRITCLGTQGGLLDTSVHRLIEDDGGYLWMTGDRGIRRASRRELDEVADGKATRVSVVLYDDADGMKSAEANGMGTPAGWRTRDGLLWFPTQGGVARIDPVAVRRDMVAPHPAIERVSVGGTVYAPHAPIEAPAGTKDLEVRYTAPGFVRPEAMYFKYRLSGYDATWIDAGTRRVAHYTNLPPGTYRFELMARSSAGVWSAPVGTVALTLPPRLHQRLAFRIGMGLILVMAGIAVFRLRVARLRQRERMLEAVVARRTAELCAEREGLNLANQALEGARTLLQTSHTQLLSVLDQLRVGVIIVNPRHEILFVSAATRRLLAGLDEDVVGQPLDRILPIAPEALAEVQTLVRDPRPGTRLTVRLQLRSGQRCFTELEARLDPRDEKNSLLYLYDVTETYELKRVQDFEASAGTPVGASAGGATAGRQSALGSLIGQSVAMRFVHGQIRTVAGVNATVLIEGETGTGKELVARAIHEASPRKDRPFVAINCAGLTESLLASQLFGHRRGSFTGAVTDHVGLFESAQGGTLLLDEIGDMPMSVQTHLLRVLQEREILRLGESKPRRIDVRVLVATHRSLEQEVASGKFREDLMYRILVARIALPPLRERLEDIPLLATAFMQQFCTTHRKPLEGFSRDAMERLMAQRWPGNVRELRAAIEWAVIRATPPMIRQTDLPTDVVSGDVPQARGKMLDEERRRLVETLTRTGGNRSVAARLLGVSRATLYRRLAALGDDPSADQ